jgi:hypothetical protein
MQQQRMYQQPSPVAMGNTGYYEGGDVTAFDPSMYGAGFSFLSPSTPTETGAEPSTVMLYSPDGLTTQSFSLPAQQAEYDSKLAAGWSTTQVQTPQVTTQAGDNDDPPIKPETGEQGKKFSEMSGEELQNALNQNKKAHTLMQGMTAINPMLGIAGLAATKYAEKQILENMKKKGVDPVEAAEEGGIIDSITNWFSETFGTKKDEDPAVTPKKPAVTTARSGEGLTYEGLQTAESRSANEQATQLAKQYTDDGDSSKSAVDRHKEIFDKAVKSGASAGVAGSAAAKAVTSGLSDTEVKGGAELDTSYGITGLNKGGLMKKKKK